MDNMQQKFNADANVPFHVGNNVILMNECIRILSLIYMSIWPAVPHCDNDRNITSVSYFTNISSYNIHHNMV